MNDTCIFCGVDLPEGMQICRSCEKHAMNNASIEPEELINICHSCKHHIKSIFKKISLINHCNRCMYNTQLKDMYEKKV